MTILWTIAILIGTVVLDQLSKMWVVRAIAPVGSVWVWENVLRFTYVENSGAAFGMLAQHRWIFLVFSTAAIAGIAVYLFWKRPRGLWAVSLSLIAGGGVGNMIDRLAHGYVVDFIDVTCIPGWKFVFNAADTFVCVGCGLLLLAMILDEVRERRGAAAARQKTDG